MKCPFCKISEISRELSSGTVMWKCGSWENKNKKLLEQSTHCEILTLTLEVERLRKALDEEQKSKTTET